MERPKVAEHNVETGEVVVREMNDEELAQWELDKLEYERVKAEQEAAEAAKIEAKASALAKLAKLGLTEEEAAAIAGA